MGREKSETKRDEAERQVDLQLIQIGELSRKLEDVQRRAETASKLKDQLQEFKHTQEKLQKAEAKADSLKKKLEETGDFRKQIKVYLSS